MTKSGRRIFASVVMASFCALAHSQTAPAQTRGELLYSTHCVSCHTTQMHWRNDKQAFDWDSLRLQVRRWQTNTGLTWTEADITEVSRYLNDTIYNYPQVNNRVGLLAPQNSQPRQASNGQ